MELYRAKKMNEEDGDEGWAFGYFRKYLFVGKIVAEITTLNGESWSVDPETVGQYIGVHDDEGDKELYEGDVIKMIYGGEEIIGSIEYCGGGFILASDDFEDGSKWISELTENDGRFFWIPTSVRIGNMIEDKDRFCL